MAEDQAMNELVSDVKDRGIDDSKEMTKRLAFDLGKHAREVGNLPPSNLVFSTYGLSVIAGWLSGKKSI